MNSQLRWKFIFIAAVILFCIYGLIGVPTFPTSWSQIKQNVADRIKLGLDLKGGSHLVLQVQVDEAIGQRCDQAVDQLTRQVHEKNIIVGDIRGVAATHIDGEQITRRIHALGLADPTIATTGRSDNEMLVQLPGEGDPSRARAVIQAGGQLTLNRVADDQTYPSEVAALSAKGGVLAPGTVIVPGKSEAQAGFPSQTVYYILDRAPIVTGQDLRAASPSPNGTNPGQYEVRFSLSTAAATRFGPFTEAQSQLTPKGRMAIVLDHQVYSAPVVNSRIDDSGVIEGNFSEESANDLALVLRAGALPASIKYLEERTVGPSLGADSIRAGVRASI